MRLEVNKMKSSKKCYCKICGKETKHEVVIDEFDDEEKICVECGLWTENGE
jgi:uncharacterized Zn finger protein